MGQFPSYMLFDLLGAWMRVDEEDAVCYGEINDLMFLFKDKNNLYVFK